MQTTLTTHDTAVSVWSPPNIGTTIPIGAIPQSKPSTSQANNSEPVDIDLLKRLDPSLHSFIKKQDEQIKRIVSKLELLLKKIKSSHQMPFALARCSALTTSITTTTNTQLHIYLFDVL